MAKRYEGVSLGNAARNVCAAVVIGALLMLTYVAIVLRGAT